MTRAEVIQSMPTWPAPTNDEALAWVNTPSVEYDKDTVLLADIEQYIVDHPPLRQALRTAIQGQNEKAEGLRDDLISATALERDATSWETLVADLPLDAQTKSNLVALKVSKKSPAAANDYDSDRHEWILAIIEARGE